MSVSYAVEHPTWTRHVSARCSMLQHVARSAVEHPIWTRHVAHVAVCCSMLQHVAVCVQEHPILTRHTSAVPACCCRLNSVGFCKQLSSLQGTCCFTSDLLALHARYYTHLSPLLWISLCSPHVCIAAQEARFIWCVHACIRAPLCMPQRLLQHVACCCSMLLALYSHACMHSSALFACTRAHLSHACMHSIALVACTRAMWHAQELCGMHTSASNAFVACTRAMWHACMHAFERSCACHIAVELLVYAA